MKELLQKYFLEILKNTHVSLALLISVIFFLTPVFMGATSFVQSVWAHDRQLEELEFRVRKIDMVDEKINLLMIEIGISKNKIELIEHHYIKKGE